MSDGAGATAAATGLPSSTAASLPHQSPLHRLHRASLAPQKDISRAPSSHAPHRPTKQHAGAASGWAAARAAEANSSISVVTAARARAMVAEQGAA